MGKAQPLLQGLQSPPAGKCPLDGGKDRGTYLDTGDRPPDHVSPESLRELDAGGGDETTAPDDPAEAAVKKLERVGFSDDTIYAMAQADWERWNRYMRDRGWTWGPERKRENKRHERLVDSWDATLADPALKGIALKSLADAHIALAKLKRLGFSEDTAYAMAKQNGRLERLPS